VCVFVKDFDFRDSGFAFCKNVGLVEMRDA